MSISSEEYRDALRHFPSGVTIVTVRSGETRHGLTVSAFASVSPAPPLILIIVDHRHRAYQILQEDGATFAVNILGQDQVEFSNRFAWVKDEDRFAVGDWATAATGAPVLTTALAWLDCSIHSIFKAGTHTVYLGEVQASSVERADEMPLAYWNRGYHRLQEVPNKD